MPVDPGNLLMMGRIGALPVLGAPGCARSPKENGFDWVLQRLLADVPVTGADIRRLGAGGLLMEIVSRPQPRDGARPAAVRTAVRKAAVRMPPRERAVTVAAIVLAAGTASRYRAADPSVATKLVASYGGVHGGSDGAMPLVRRAVAAALASRAGPVVVVTGHAAAEVRAALDGCAVGFVHNADYASGLASSLRAGVSALPDGASGALVLLGDMPEVTAPLLDRLIAAFAAAPGADAAVPVHGGRRGNPALLGRGLFAPALALAGDEGARRLLARARVVEVEVDDAGVLLDVDEPAALRAVPGRGR